MSELEQKKIERILPGNVPKSESTTHQGQTPEVCRCQFTRGRTKLWSLLSVAAFVGTLGLAAWVKLNPANAPDYQAAIQAQNAKIEVMDHDRKLLLFADCRMMCRPGKDSQFTPDNFRNQLEAAYKEARENANPFPWAD